MNADDFNHAEIVSGRLTMTEISVLVMFFQSARGLDPDGKAGPMTQALLEKMLPVIDPTPSQNWTCGAPMPTLGDGRKPIITSSYKPPDRPKHVGVDLFYLY